MIGRRGKTATQRPISGARPLNSSRAPQRAAAAAPVLRGPQRDRHEPDWVLVLSVVALAALGILMVYSSTGVSGVLDKDPFGTVGPQAIWGVLGAALMIGIMRVDYRYLRVVSVPALVL